jgi:hypothetical protein
MDMQLVFDEKGQVKLTEDKRPIFKFPDGREEGVDVPGMYTKITTLNAEAKKHREAAETLTAKIKPLEDRKITDLDAFLKSADQALETVKGLKDSELIKIGDVEKLKSQFKTNYENALAETKKAYDAQLAQAQKMQTDLQASVKAMMVKSAFDQSAFLRDKTTLPSDIAYQAFGSYFEVEEKDGRLGVIPKDRKGDPIFSVVRPGELASPEEAIQALVESYEFKDRILKSGPAGSGAPGNSGPGGSASGKFNADHVGKMSPEEYIKLRREGKI